MVCLACSRRVFESRSIHPIPEVSGPFLISSPYLCPSRLSYSIPIMVASMFAKWTGDRLYGGSLYDVQIRLNHYPYLHFDKSSNKMGDAFASDIMHPR